MVVFPLEIFAYPATSMMMGNCPNTAKINNNPVAVITELSMMPIGGMKKPVTSRPIAAIRQIQNGRVFLSVFLSVIVSID